MTNDKLLTELRQRLIKINRDKNCSHMDKQVRGLLDLIEEEWTEVGPEPCGLQERKHADDIAGEEYTMLIVWEYCVETMASHGAKELANNAPHEDKLANLAHLLHCESDSIGVYEMRRWAGLVGREIERAYDKAVEEGAERAGEYAVAFDFEWVPAVLEDYATTHDELIPPEEAFQYSKAHYRLYMERAQAVDNERRKKEANNA